jgi:hypothetical protein
MAKHVIPSREILIELLDYNPKTGEFFWKPREPKWFKPNKYRTAKSYADQFNAQHAGKKAFTAPADHGHLQGIVLGNHLPAHRVAWVIYFGEEPEQIRHINGDKTDNRIANLISENPSLLRRNQTMFADNTSGIRGVFWDQRDNMWRAEIRVNNKNIALGYFASKQRAADARKSAEFKYGWRQEDDAATGILT